MFLYKSTVSSVHGERPLSCSVDLGSQPCSREAHPALCCLLPCGGLSPVCIALQASHPQVSAWPPVLDMAVRPSPSSAQGAPERVSSRTAGKPKAKKSSRRLTKSEINRAVVSLASRVLNNMEHRSRRAIGISYLLPCKLCHKCIFSARELG